MPAVGRRPRTATATPLESPPPPIGIEDAGQLGQVLDDLEATRALAGDHPVVVVRRDNRQTSLDGDRLYPEAALFGGQSDDDDLGASAATRSLDRRGVIGHDHDCRGAEQPGRPGDALGVVARRVGDDATSALLGAERRDRDKGASKLERPDRLERLGLEEVTI